MIFINEANTKIQELLNKDNVLAIYLNMVEQYNKKHKTVYAQQMQVYITKIGIILSDCAKKEKIKQKTYLGSIDYICNKVLRNQNINLIMRDLNINDNGNAIKHTIEDVEVYFEESKNQYNKFIKEIISVTGFDAFNKCLIVSKKNKRDIPFIKELKHDKYFAVNNIKFQLKISPNYSIDKYTKKISSTLALYWPTIKEGHSVTVNITNPKNKRILGGKAFIDLGKNIDKRKDGKYIFKLNFTEEDLDRRVLSLMVDIIVYKEVIENINKKTGFLIFKKNNCYQVKKSVQVGKYSCPLSQLFKTNAEI